MGQSSSIQDTVLKRGGRENEIESLLSEVNIEKSKAEVDYFCADSNPF